MGCLCAASRGIWIQSGQWSPGAGRSALRRAFWPPQGRPTDEESLGRSILDAEAQEKWKARKQELFFGKDPYLVKNRSLAEKRAIRNVRPPRQRALRLRESVQACETERRASPLQVTQPYCWSQDPGCLRACEGRRPANDSVHEINCMKYQTRNGLPPGPAPGLPVSETGSGARPREPPGPRRAGGPGGARVPWRVRCCSRRRSLQPPSPARMPARLVLCVYPIAVGTG